MCVVESSKDVPATVSNFDVVVMSYGIVKILFKRHFYKDPQFSSTVDALGRERFKSGWRRRQETMCGILDEPLGVLCLDEAHECRNPSSLTNKAVHELAKRSVKRVALTGTAVCNSEKDVAGILRALDVSSGLQNPEVRTFLLGVGCVVGCGCGVRDRQTLGVEGRFYF